MKIQSIILSITLSIFFLTLTSCNDDDVVIPNEEELITTVTWTLTPAGSGNPVVMSFRDIDGDGGQAPVITGGILSTDATYTASLQLTNESISPAEDITSEIRAEAEEHQFFYETKDANVVVEYNDNDADQLPIGLETNVITGAASEGMITLILRHEPSKTANGVSEGDITNAGGETDIEVRFPVTIQ